MIDLLKLRPCRLNSEQLKFIVIRAFKKNWGKKADRIKADT